MGEKAEVLHAMATTATSIFVITNAIVELFAG
jgi:hypothetical protein